MNDIRLDKQSGVKVRIVAELSFNRTKIQYKSGLLQGSFLETDHDRLIDAETGKPVGRGIAPTIDE